MASGTSGRRHGLPTPALIFQGEPRCLVLACRRAESYQVRLSSTYPAQARQAHRNRNEAFCTTPNALPQDLNGFDLALGLGLHPSLSEAFRHGIPPRGLQWDVVYRMVVHAFLMSRLRRWYSSATKAQAIGSSLARQNRACCFQIPGKSEVDARWIFRSAKRNNA